MQKFADKIVVLVVTKNYRTRRVVSAELRKAGARIKMIRNFSYISQAISNTNPDIIVIDYEFLHLEEFNHIKYACADYPKICIVEYGLCGHVQADFITSHDKIDSHNMYEVVSKILKKHEEDAPQKEYHYQKRCKATRIRPRTQRVMCIQQH